MCKLLYEYHSEVSQHIKMKFPVIVCCVKKRIVTPPLAFHLNALG